MIKLFSMFSGYGGAEFALDLANIKYDIVGYSEIDKFAKQCWEQNHSIKCRTGIKYDYGSCKDINPNELPDFDLLTGGFPCQPFSIAGKRKGKDDDRGLLFDEIIRIAQVKKPKYMLLENVEGLLSMKGFWQYVKSELNRIGYSIRYKVLKSCDYGIPQNRPRLWILCNHNGFEPFKEVFPQKEKLKITVKNILEDNVDESYYLSEHQYKYAIQYSEKKGKSFFDNVNRCVARTLLARNPNRSIHAENIIIHSKQPRTGDPKKGGTGHLCRVDGISYTIDTGNSQYIEFKGQFRVLTPKECFRLMGFLNDEIKLDGISKSQQYHLAGNGWDINIASKIFKKWLGD